MSCQGAVSPKGARKLHDADVVYLYDGSFEGFLCCVYESFAQHELPFAVWTPQRETATLYPVKEIATDPAVARRVFASFGKKLGGKSRAILREWPLKCIESPRKALKKPLRTLLGRKKGTANECVLRGFPPRPLP